MKRTDYEIAFNTYRYTNGTCRIGMDYQLVDVATHTTIANSDEAQAWIQKHVVKADRQRALLATYPPATKHIGEITARTEA